MRRAGQVLALLALLVPALAGQAQAAQALQSYAVVQADGSLKVRGQTVRLYGVFIPDSGRACSVRIRPVRCGERAAQALRDRIQGFVTCHPQARYRDGSLAAVCTVNGRSILDPPLDLGAWLIAEGLALAGPDAPFAYVAHERLAEANRRGIWGFQLDGRR